MIIHNDEISPQHLKQKKNPHMNFSLLYLQESNRGRNVKNGKKEVNKKQSVADNRPKTCREKGSEHPYIDGLSHAINAKKR